MWYKTAEPFSTTQEGRMAEQMLSELLTVEILFLLEETFENVHGAYLDQGTSLFETLATISAEEASRPVSVDCASLAAQVEHVWFYLETIMRYMRGEHPQVDWSEIWRTVREVTPGEWSDSQRRLRETYQRMCTFLTDDVTWKDDDEVGGALELLVHSAYHLGEIRQALCVIKPGR
jgi:hypothetical protein